ncbi:MAG: DUF445 family protein [bacterium]
MKWHYLMIPVIGAVIGWVTNYIAIKMLFRPYRPVRILGFTFQGLLPKRRKEFALSIARTVERDLLTVEDITRFFEGVNWEEEVELAVAQTIEARKKSKSLSRILKTPILGLIGNEILRQVQKNLTHKIIAKIEEQKGRLIEKFQNAIELKEVVSRKVDGFKIEKVESLLMDLISQELTYIEAVGAVLGFIIGLAQMIFMILY